MTYPTDTSDATDTREDVDSPIDAASADETEEDALDLGDDVDDADDEPTPGTDGQAAAPRRAGPSKAAVRRVGAKLLQLQGADDEDVLVLASLYGVDADPLEVTVAVMTTDRSALSAVRDLNDIAEAEDPFEAMQRALEKGRHRMKAVHGLLAALSAATVQSLNGNDAKAGAALARDVLALPNEAKGSLARVLDLARRTA